MKFEKKFCKFAVKTRMTLKEATDLLKSRGYNFLEESYLCDEHFKMVAYRHIIKEEQFIYILFDFDYVVWADY